VNNDKDTLLANARQSTKNELAVRRKAQRERLQTFWDDCHDDLAKYARECIPDHYEGMGKVFNHETALANVRKKLHRCQAQTREGFIAWTVKQLAKEPHFHLVANAITGFDLDVSNWIDTATLRQNRYAGFPEHYKDGDLYREKMGESDGVPIVWTIPSRYWAFVQKVWPVFAKRKPDGFYIAKKIAGATVPVHRLILPVTAGDTVESTSGNLLDWTSLYVKPLNRSGIYEGRNTSWNAESDRANTAQEEFEHRFQSAKVLENYGVNFDNTRFVLPQPIPVNADLGAKTTCWGKVGSTGWVAPSTPAERDCYAPELPSLPVEQSARRLAAEQALDQLGL
jgi:hypothetical protein